MPTLAPLAVNAALLATAILVLWLVNLKTRDPSFIDSWWPLGMVLAAVVTLAMTGADPRRWLIVGLCALWGLRLGGYLFWRWRRQGPDRRYAEMMAAAEAERGWSYGLASLLFVFALQAPLQFIVSLPAQLGELAPPQPLGALAATGAALALVGIGFEALGDAQLARFKADPANRGKVLDTGLWRYTRHPNYFGDACLWWGVYLIAAETGFGAWSLPGPLLLTFLLTRFSGAPTVEGHMGARPGYAEYVRRTSSFVPWPPKRT
jgi:steroid 5-alpha reductase family enzyme